MRETGFLSWRIAEENDIPLIETIQRRSIEELQKPFLTPQQIESSWKSMGLDHQLISDGTYFIISRNGGPAGCGGWGKRATLFGGSHSAGRSDAFLDPHKDPARIRAMYTDPDHIRCGVGRLLLALGEASATKAGFVRLTLGATLAGEPLYRAAGFEPVSRVEDASGDGSMVPVITMEKPIEPGVAEATIKALTGKAF